jgi:hypothetical protein
MKSRARHLRLVRAVLLVAFLVTIGFIIRDADRGSAALLGSEATVAGLLLLVALFLQRKYPEPKREASSAARGAPSPPTDAQVAGRRCAACDKRILTQASGKPCATCGAPLHDGACIARHAAREHGVESDVPYR